MPVAPFLSNDHLVEHIPHQHPDHHDQTLHHNFADHMAAMRLRLTQQQHDAELWNGAPTTLVAVGGSIRARGVGSMYKVDTNASPASVVTVGDSRRCPDQRV